MAPWPYPYWIAHRGAGKLAPENTLAAFRLGAAHGFRAFECDVKLSADGVPFLLHDATLQRTTSGRGPSSERIWAELSRLDAGSWHSRAHAGEPPASLEAVAAFCLANRFALNIEIKPSPGQEAATGRAVAVAVGQLWPADAVPPLLSSFQPESLQAAQAAAPDTPRALLIDSLQAGWFEKAERLGCSALVAHYPLYDRAMVERLHAAGMRALAYTVNDPAPVAWLRQLGLAGVITDAVDRFSPCEVPPEPDPPAD